MNTTTWLFSNEDIMKIVKSLDDAGLLTKGFRETTIGMVLGTLGASFLGNLLTGKGVKWSNITGTIRAELKVQIELVKVQLDHARVFGTVSSFKQFLATKVLSK